MTISAYTLGHTLFGSEYVLRDFFLMDLPINLQNHFKAL